MADRGDSGGKPRVRRRGRAWAVALGVIVVVWSIRGAISAFTPGNPNPYITPLAVLITLPALLAPLVRSGRYGKSWWADIAVALGAVLLVSGAVVQALPAGGDFRRAMLLAHLVAGLLVLLPVHLYLFGHLRDAVRRRPIGLIRGGVASILVLLGSIWTGTLITVIQAREMEPLATPHMLLSWAAVGLSVWHAVVGRRVLARRESPAPVRRRLLIGAGLPVLLLIGAGVAHETATVGPAPQAFPLEREGPPLSRLEQETSPSAHPANWTPATCSSPGGYCHIDNVTQWKRSAHARSANPAYRAALERLEETRPGKSRYCASCHEPRRALTDQGPMPGAGPSMRAELAPVGVHGEPVTDGATGRPATLPPTGPKELAEGVGCQVCHRSTFESAGTASYRMRATPADLTRTAAIPFFNFPMVLADLDRHRADFADEVEEAGPTSCAACHVHHLPEALHPPVPGLELADKLGPWEASRFARGTEDERRACIDCHMPRTYGPIDPTWTRSHAFPSGNTGVPWLLDMPERIEEAEAFLRDDRVELSLVCDPPTMGLPGSVCRVRVANSGVGHRFPAGPRDIEQTWVEAELLKPDGSLHAVVAASAPPANSPATQPPAPPDADAAAVASRGAAEPMMDWSLVLYDEDDRRLDLHEFWAAARIEGRAAIEPGAHDEAEFYVGPTPAGTRLRVRLLRRRYNPRFVAAAWGDDRGMPPITEIAAAEASLPGGTR